MSVERSRSILAKCRDAGFALAGVCDASPTKHAEFLRRWLADGKHGEMGYLDEHLAARLDPELVLPGVRSAVMVADVYHGRNDAPDMPEFGVGRIARYARGDDYHDTMKRRLRAVCDELREAHPDAGFRVCVDTAPVVERELAERAGLGWTGKHTLAIHPVHGSWMLLGGIYTTLELTPPPEQERHADHCGTCTRCIDACPTEAITPWSVDATQCISYLTIEHRSAVDDLLHPGMGAWIAGCDVCQEVCPHNSARPGSTEVASHHPAYEARVNGFELLEVLGWDEAGRRGGVRGSSLRRIKLGMFRRNAAIAAGNAIAADPEHGRSDALRDALETIERDEAEPVMLRDAARASLARDPGRAGR